MMVKEVHDELGHLIFDSSHSGVLDPEVLAKMSELGVDTKQLGQAILQRTATDGTLVYDILRRNLLAEKTQEVIKRIQQGMSGNVHGEKMPRRTTATLVRPIGAVNVRRNSKPSENVGTGLWEPRFGMKRLSKQPLRVPHIPTPRPTGELM
jgi:hypothetical protein